MSQPETNHTLDAERSILGCALIEPSSFAEVKGVLAEEDFELPANREVFLAMDALASRGAAIDVVTLGEELRTRGARLALEGGVDTYLIRIASGVPIVGNLPHYADIVVRRSAIRKFKLLMSELTAKVDNPEAAGEAQKVLLDAQKMLTQIQYGRMKPGTDVADLVSSVLDEFQARVDARKTGGARLTGLDTTLDGLNALTGGWRTQTLNIVAARTSLGKTAYACQVSLINAIEHEIPCLFFSLEMGPKELVERFFARRARIDSAKLRFGEIDAQGWSSLMFVGTELGKAGRITISTTRTLPGIVTEARAFRVRHPNQRVLYVVDYLQIARTGERGRSREQEIAEVSGELKGTAVDLDAPVVVPAQLNRGPEIEDREPKVSDIRDSGAIEQDADTILFIVRKRDDLTGACYGKLSKNRNGAVGEFDLKWNGAIYELRDADPVPQEQYP